MKQEAKELTSMKQVAISLAKLNSDCSRLTTEISALEKSLATTGSTKTADDVQEELGALSDKMYALHLLSQCSMLTILSVVL